MLDLFKFYYTEMSDFVKFYKIIENWVIQSKCVES